MRGIRSKILVGAMSLGLLVPSAAFAASPTTEGYNSPGGVVQDEIQTKPASTSSNTPAAATTPAAAANSGGKLPFTGLDLGLVVIAGGVLLVLGLGIRRFTRPPSGIA
jgi:hypothetical protein